MASTDSDLIALAKLAARQAHLINLMLGQLADQACLLSTHLEKCQRCKDKPTTVVHNHINVRACDRCAAECVVTSAKEFVKAFHERPDDPFNVVRSSVMNEELWSDLPEASRIRRLSSFVEELKLQTDSPTTEKH